MLSLGTLWRRKEELLFFFSRGSREDAFSGDHVSNLVKYQVFCLFVCGFFCVCVCFLNIFSSHIQVFILCCL